MKIPTIKLVEKLEVPKMGIGTWGVGGYMKKSPYNDDENDVSQIKYQIEKGLTLVDTWLAQAEGNMVEIVSKAIQGLPRNRYQVVAKLDVKNFVNKEDVEKTVDEFLSKLKIDFVDILQIHKPQWDGLSVRETISEMDRMIDIGKAKYLAISNANVDLLTESMGFAKNKFCLMKLIFQ